jgi:hypothetical protein
MKPFGKMDAGFRFPWTPKIRTRLIASDRRQWLDLPFGDWLAEDCNEADRHQIMTSDCLTKQQCRAFWDYMGRTDKPPKRLWIYLWRADVDELFPPKN